MSASHRAVLPGLAPLRRWLSRTSHAASLPQLKQISGSMACPIGPAGIGILEPAEGMGKCRLFPILRESSAETPTLPGQVQVPRLVKNICRTAIKQNALQARHLIGTFQKKSRQKCGFLFFLLLGWQARKSSAENRGFCSRNVGPVWPKALLGAGTPARRSATAPAADGQRSFESPP